MSGGSWLNHGTDSIGTTPGYMGAVREAAARLARLQGRPVRPGHDGQARLGRPGRPDVLRRRSRSRCRTRRSPPTTTPPLGLVRVVGRGHDNLNNTLTRTVDLTGATTARSRPGCSTDIEQDYDYLYAEVSTDGGATWTPSATPLVRQRRPGPAQKSWDLPPYAGQSVQFRFRYATDGGLHFEGPFLDDLAVTGRRADRATTSRPAPTAGPPTGSPVMTAPAPRCQPLLPGGEPHLHRVRQDPQDRSVQLRLGQHQARLGGAVPLPERPAGLVRRR